MAGRTMHAIRYDGYGGGIAALKHVEIPIPSPKKNEVLVKVEATAINPVDYKLQEGIARPFLPSKFPFIPASDIAGEIVELGPGVQNFKVGDKVVSMLNIKDGGGLAEYAAAPLGRTLKRPEQVSAVDGAAIPIAASTAMHALQAVGTNFDGTPNERLNILIIAASGGVGSFAVQLARLAGHHITATCGARNLEVVRSWGADEVLDYKTPEGEKYRSRFCDKYDAILDLKGDTWRSLMPYLTERGRVVDITPWPVTHATALLQKLTFAKKRVVPLTVVPTKDDLELIMGLMKDGKLKTVVDSKHPLSKAEEALSRCVEGHATGKIIVEM